MRFISIFTHEPNSNTPPTEAEMAKMGQLIEDAMKAGWLIATEGVSFGSTGVRVHRSAGGQFRVTDGPFAEAKEVLGGYALLQAASKEEIVEHTRRFLEVAGQGTCEIYQLYDESMGDSGCGSAG
ncbi:YciI family protein [Planctomyces sp. SH-PL14]|uniref:YciI family protein n=1 Tax=Planctomyces sp. SH-PL14 TaxID=1632864 RepID=UPI00078B3FB0|nr:YciI family protein [Planctomyces sp. SH-PL14]AMV20032.1 YCII-related domain protein [Planctomyces sp. SH-PL14]